MAAAPETQLHAWVEYLRDMGVYDLYRRVPSSPLQEDALALLRRAAARATPSANVASHVAPRERASTPPPVRPVPSAAAPGNAPKPTQRPAPGLASPRIDPIPPRPSPVAESPKNYFSTDEGTPTLPPELAAPMPKPSPLQDLFPMPAAPIPAAQRQAALEQLQAEIGDCTRCPLAYAGRHTIVFGEGDPNAQLMFIGEGPGADEDTSGRPFIGKAGQLLNNMIGAMGLLREQVYIANIVKCRPPGNRTPEFVEAISCSQFLLKQIDIVRPRVIVALGSTAATYVLGVRQSLSALRGQWFPARGAKVAVTYHPAFLLRDPRQKVEAWKDLQRVMHELGLKPSAKNAEGA